MPQRRILDGFATGGRWRRLPKKYPRDTLCKGSELLNSYISFLTYFSPNRQAIATIYMKGYPCFQ